MPRRRSDYRGLLESNRVRLLGMIQERPGVTLKEISEHTAIPLNTARDHLWALQEEGLVTAQKVATGRRGRPPLTYYAVDDPASNPVVQERLDRVEERRAQLRRMVRRRTGAADTAVESQLEVLYEHFEETGFAPTVGEDKLKIEISPGPHRKLYEEYGDQLCEVHSRLIEDTLSLTEGPLALGEVKPFVGPDECLVVLYLKEVAPEGSVIKDCAERIKPV